ncbi:DUF2924 domain-containing protein [Antarcticimicrobium luteum]|uniref:DUF2924 domain-containing protein n=1 Tax=Antarcticimicrobium luteum TaxID=2547397 RepID=A0A4R5VBM4_9RHOB|nr:DUF2924 domain-containing protein [Antarcticimicrobium luteum]TDK49688.1 DUF2924 domain-containing protein [Antarcticimicrobium luteum]
MSLPGDLPDLDDMARPELLALWQELFDAPAPRMLSQPFLRRFIAFELQSRRHGGLPRKVTAAIEKGADKSQRATSPTLKPGGRLLREWNGVTHVVDVTEGGFAWNGQTYRSLSAIAREITGAHWSGPRFFGLKGKAAR